jgi:hypothetical protein
MRHLLALVVILLLILLLQSKRVSFFPYDSALDVYKDMAAGAAQVNALADFLQEKEDDMKSLKPYFEGEGYNLDYTLPMHPTTGDEFDYSKSTDFDYSLAEGQSPISTIIPISQSPIPIVVNPIETEKPPPVFGAGEFFASLI